MPTAVNNAGGREQFSTNAKPQSKSFLTGLNRSKIMPKFFRSAPVNQTMRSARPNQAWKSYLNLALLVTSVAAFTAGIALANPALIALGIIALAIPFTLMPFIGRLNASN